MPEGLAEKIRALGGDRGRAQAGDGAVLRSRRLDGGRRRPRPRGVPRAARAVRRARAARGLPLRGHRHPALRRRLHGAVRRAGRARGRAAARGVGGAGHPRRAARTSTSQLEAERGISLPARIGINTGPVVVGTVGNDLKMDYTAIGDTTNLASRLESLAQPGHDPDQRVDGAAGARLLPPARGRAADGEGQERAGRRLRGGRRRATRRVRWPSPPSAA